MKVVYLIWFYVKAETVECDTTECHDIQLIRARVLNDFFSVS